MNEVPSLRQSYDMQGAKVCAPCSLFWMRTIKTPPILRFIYKPFCMLI